MEVPAGGVALATMSDGGESYERWLDAARSPEDVPWTVRLQGASISKGDVVLLVGGSEQLGAWDPTRAVEATRDGNDFVATVQVPRGDVLEYKFVVREDGGALVWEQRDNRYQLVLGAGTVSARWEA